MNEIIRLTIERRDDGARIVVYVENESEIADVESRLNARVLSRRPSNKTEMQMEQSLCVSGTTQQELADNDPFGPNRPSNEWASAKPAAAIPFSKRRK